MKSLPHNKVTEQISAGFRQTRCLRSHELTSPRAEGSAIKWPRQSFAATWIFNLAFSTLTFGIFHGAAQTIDNPTAGERGPHHQTWEYITWEKNSREEDVARTNRYIELATGLNRWDAAAQDWVKSEVQLEIVNGTAVSRKTQFELIVAGDVTDPAGAIDLLMPDGETRFVAHPIGLVYIDALGNAAYIAKVQSTAGIVWEGNQVIWPSAFDLIDADIRVSVRLNGFEHDVILRERPPAPEDLGFDPATTKLQFWTLLERPGNPKVRERMIEKAPGKVDADDFIEYSSMHIPLGRAFVTGQPDRGILVMKDFAVIDGNTYLIETIDYEDAEPDLVTLPEPQAARFDKEKFKAMVQSQSQKHPKKPLTFASSTRSKDKKSLALASGLPEEKPGYVLDYIVESQITTNRFYGNSTYYISGPVTLGTNSTVFEAGAVIKFHPTNTAKIKVQGPIVWEGEPYIPVVFTARDNHAIGQVIGNATLASTPYADIALEIDATTAGVSTTIRNIRVTHSAKGIKLTGGSSHVIENAQFVNCTTGIYLDGATLSLRNALFYNSGSVLAGQNSNVGRLEHVTVNGATSFNYNNSIGTLTVTNSLLVAVGTLGTYSGTSVSTASSTAGVFETAGGASHYLASGSPYRDAGSTNINLNLLKAFKSKTTYAPVIWEGPTWGTPTTLSWRTIRDNDSYPDLGYHYDVLDYALGGVYATNSVEIEAGTAFATFTTSGRTYGLALGGGGSLTSRGNFEKPVQIAPFYCVQEQSTTAWGTSGALTQVAPFSHQTPLPAVDLKFTYFSELASRAYHLYANFGSAYSIPIRHSEFVNGSVATLRPSLLITNCLFRRVTAWVQDSGNDTQTIRNSHFYGGSLDVTFGNSNWSILNTAFDNTSLAEDGYIVHNYNAYVQGASRLPVGNGNGINDVVLSSGFAYSEKNGRTFYHATTNLVDRGSASAVNFGLHHFTVLAKQGAERNTTVDIGYHYPAQTKVRFVGVDTTTQGNWKNFYGTKGYNVIQDSVSYPSFVTLTRTATNDWTWASSSSDTRALQRSASGRIAACWFSASSITINLSQNDSYPQKVSFYLLDWDGGGARSERIEIKDAITGYVYDTRNATNFNGGQYYVWEILGDVTITITNLNGGSNAVLSGIFFDEGTNFLADTDGDAVPDYLEDANGNGTADSGETDWEGSNNGLSGVVALEVFTPIK